MPISDRDRNEDWIKTLHWDLPKTVPELLGVLDVHNKSSYEQVEALEELKNKAAWEAVPPEVEHEVNEFIDKNKYK
ncbi:MAG: hypothetical protein M1483_03115 [Actinobacteria bacterium]|nr:hypothetical protein [Actinomycetota bacterium]MCL6104615.1 hypothetical protein [Actinomycetota bacterium]